MLGGSSCCGSATGGAKNAKQKVVKPKKKVKKYGKIKGGYADSSVINQEGDEEGYEEQEGDEEQEGYQVGGAKKKKGSKVGVKRALTPYNKFVKKHFAEIKKKFPDEKAPQIMQKVAVEWKIFKNK